MEGLPLQFQICEFLQTDLPCTHTKTNPIPLDLRGELWAVLEKLVEDPEPSEKFEAEYLARDTDAIELSLNTRSEEHTSELQSPCNLVCRLLLEKKKKDLLTSCQRDIF